MGFLNLTKHHTQQLPQRVQESLRKHDMISQQLISGASMILALVFGALYLLNVQQRDSMQLLIFEPVPWVLGAYIIFNCFRVMVAMRNIIPKWFMILDSFIDIALLMGLIWSFHLSYSQPLGFVLKSPTFLYIFIFISLRAFRLDPIYVLLTGLAAVVGWSVIMGLVLNDSKGSVVTNNYVEYMTSNAMLLGAEFDKLISVALTAVILAFVISRANNTLHSALQYESAKHELSRFFDKNLANRISQQGEVLKAGRGELTHASVLNVDMRGFTKLSAQISPNEVMRLLSEYQRRTVPIIQKHQGNIDKFLGDGIMATFGAIQPDPLHHKNALLAIEDLLVVIDQWNDERKTQGAEKMNINIALTSGPLISGVVGSDDRLEYTAIGDTVNLSAKLEKYNKVLGTRAICDAESWQSALKEGFESTIQAEMVTNCNVEGVFEPIDIVKLELAKI